MEDHPRLRGNYFSFVAELRGSLGSPPLTRELQDIVESFIIIFRITPAYAGTTPKPAHEQSLFWDHPRLRGNYYVTAKDIEFEVGLPPLTRELPMLLDVSLCRFGITPAYAGTTLKAPLFFTIIYSDIYKNHLVCL